MSLPPNVPIVNAGLLYVNGLQIEYGGGTTAITVNAGVARDSTNSNDIVLSNLVIVNGLEVGPNGVDFAPIVENTLYAVYVIASSTSVSTSAIQLGGGALNSSVAPNPFPPAAILSLNFVRPALPEGYDMYRRIGWAQTFPNGDTFQQWWQYGQDDNTRFYYYDIGFNVLNDGTATVFTSVPMTALVSPFPLVIPPLATQVLFDVVFNAASAADFASFLPFGSTATNGNVRFGTGVAGNPQITSLMIPTQLNGSGIPAILYKLSSASDSLSLQVTGFQDYL